MAFGFGFTSLGLVVLALVASFVLDPVGAQPVSPENASGPLSEESKRTNLEWCLNTGQPDVVVGACTILIEAGGGDPGLRAAMHHARALAYRSQRNIAPGLEDAAKAVELDQGKAAYWRTLAILRANSGELNTALEGIDEAIRRDPNDAISFVVRGDIYRVLWRPERGMDDYNTALRINPNLPEGYKSRAYAYLGFQEPMLAIRDYDHAIRLRPDYVDAVIDRGVAYDMMGQFERAIEDFDLALQMDPSHHAAHISRGASYLKLGRYRRAIEDFDRAIWLSPQHAPSYYNRALAWASLGDRERALADFVQARQLDQNFPEPPSEMYDRYRADFPAR